MPDKFQDSQLFAHSVRVLRQVIVAGVFKAAAAFRATAALRAAAAFSAAEGFRIG